MIYAPTYAALRKMIVPVLAVLLAGLAIAPADAHNVVEAAGAVVSIAPVESTAGTVEELIVENRVTGTTTRHVGLRFADGSGVALRGADVGSLPSGAQVRV
ncbi:MAG: hypothetical protein GZ089_08475, partial [Aromatoleum sp.]|nr:hypothetical protein [Aromatoleum sp.]